MVYRITGARYSIQIGCRGEAYANPIVIDISPWLERWPDGMAAILVKRPKDKQYYMARNIVQDNTEKTLTWTPDATDTEKVALNIPVTIQVIFCDGTLILAKAPVWMCRVIPSLDGVETAPPETDMPWVQSVLNAASEAVQSANSAAENAVLTQNAKDAAEAAAENAQASADMAYRSAVNAETYAANAASKRDEIFERSSQVESAAASAITAADRAESAYQDAHDDAERTLNAAQSVAGSVAIIESATDVVDDLVERATQMRDEAEQYADSAAAEARDAKYYCDLTYRSANVVREELSVGVIRCKVEGSQMNLYILEDIDNG